jgi:hypothetical protein
MFSYQISARHISKVLKSTFNSMSSSNSNSIQYIYDNLISINDWTQAVNSPLSCKNIDECLQLMNTVSLQDLGLHTVNLELVPRSFCMHIVDNDKFHISIFIIPKKCKLPLHDHPNMSVLSKVIKGNLKMRSFNIEKDRIMKSGKMLFPANITNDVTKTTKDKSWFLSPSINNIHEFEAIHETAVVFDVLMPPYSEENGRPCNFYEECFIDGNRFLAIGPEPELPSSVEYRGIKPRI